MKSFCTLICLMSLNILCHSAPQFNKFDRGEECTHLEVKGGSSQTNGFYQKIYILDSNHSRFVWQKPTEDRVIFNKGDSNGWTIGTEGQSLYGTSYYFKSSKQNLPLPFIEETTWTSSSNGEVTVRCICPTCKRPTQPVCNTCSRITTELKGCVGKLSLFQGETSLHGLVANRPRDGDLHSTIKANENENNHRIDYVKADGDCCWEIESNDGEIETVDPENQTWNIPSNFYIHNIYAANNCF